MLPFLATIQGHSRIQVIAIHKNCNLIRELIQLQRHMLDLDKIGPDWKVAAEHGQACTPGRPIRIPNNSTSTTSIQIHSQPGPKGHNLCECCLNIIQKEPIPLCQNSKQLQFLGFGFPLYFIFTKYAIILLTLQLVTYSALSVTWALDTSEDICLHGHVRQLPNGNQGVCTSWLLRFMRTELVVSRQEIVLRWSSFIIHLMALLYMRDTIKKTNDYYDQRTTSLSDYSVLITGLPPRPGNGKRIRDFMARGFSETVFTVEELILLNQLEDYYEIKEEKDAVIREKQAWLRKHESQQKTMKLAELDRMLANVNGRLEKEHDRQVGLINQDEAICEKAVLVMESEDAKDGFLESWEKLDKCKLTEFFGQGSGEIGIDEAPEPKEILWENINYPASKRTWRLLMGWTLTILFIAAVTGVFYGVLTAKGHVVEQVLKEIKANPNDPEAVIMEERAKAVTMLAMLSIIFFNKFALSFVLHLFTDIEKHRTGSQYEFSFGLKYTLGLFFTTAIMTLLVEDFALNNIYKEQFGVVEEQSIMFFFNAFLVPIIWLINPWHLFKLFKRLLYKGRNDLTQREAHAIMEDPKYSMGKKYAQLIQSVWFTYLYYSVIPAGCLMILIGLILFYWVDKYTLLRRCSINENVNGELSMRAMKLIDATLFLRAIGEIIFDAQIRDGIAWESIACTCVGVVYLLLPIDNILTFFHKEKFRAEEKPYREVKSSFIQNYHTLHPLYAKERYALISGVDIMAQIIGPTKHLLHQGKNDYNDTKEQLFNSMDFLRQKPKDEINVTQEALVEVRQARRILQMSQG